MHRLITLGGAPGIGKTRVALELLDHAARRHRRTGFAYLGELAGDSSATFDAMDEDMVATVARTVQEALGITDISTADPIAVLTTHLSPRPADPGPDERGRAGTLLVIDNCERVRDAVGDLAAILLAETPDVQVVTTSRGELGMPGELFIPLTPLTVPAERSEATAPKIRHRRAEDRAIPRHSRDIGKPGHQPEPAVTSSHRTLPPQNPEQLVVHPLPDVIELRRPTLRVRSPGDHDGHPFPPNPITAVVIPHL
ncbi:hypothetical protein [Actinokineospora enzanensis]|uniref:hypothetical protein n=1 Tax=Actinokineospora enzanensis TaxID=155975 RepID=UPI000368F49D|nr:hypothetical protein [Actinokineospora enzanensis]